MDFSGAQTLMGTFKTFAIYAGAVICFGGLIFAGIRMLSGRFQDAIPGLFGALFGAGVLGWGAGWIGSRFAYVSVSRASHHAQIYTNNAASLAEGLSHDVTKASAIDFGKVQCQSANVGLEQADAFKRTVSSGLALSL